MATNYPDGPDVFTVPSLPEETPLSSAGSSDRNHIENHRDLGDAIRALQEHAAQKGHDHSGDPDDPLSGPKLDQGVTHEDADTDTGPDALHHTLGRGANQAAPGNHVHSYTDLQNQPIQVCTSTTRPATPSTGLLIWETNTLRMYCWTGSKWLFLTGGGDQGKPGLSLRQSSRQRINDDNTWSSIEWNEEVSDPYNFFNRNTSRTDIVVRQAGTYQVEAAIQWDPQIVPDRAEVEITRNGASTGLRQNQFMRGNLHSPGFSQTLHCSGTLRFSANDVMRVRVRCVVSGSLIGKIFSFFDPDSAINSRLDMTFVGG